MTDMTSTSLLWSDKTLNAQHLEILLQNIERTSTFCNILLQLAKRYFFFARRRRRLQLPTKLGSMLCLKEENTLDVIAVG